MQVLRLPIDDAGAPAAAARAIARGEVIAFPTDTVYGVGVDLWQPDAIARLFALKGRPDDKALPVLLAEASACALVATDVPPAAELLMRAFWPGALTIVVHRRRDVPDAVGPGARTVGVRVPAHDALRRVLAATGPLATSSANRAGRPPATHGDAVVAALGTGLALVLEGGAARGSAPSTVVDVTGPGPVVRRRGAIDVALIEAILGCAVPDTA